MTGLIMKSRDRFQSIRKAFGRGRRVSVMLTAYDAPTAVLLRECGADAILVGDSVGTVVLGYASPHEVRLDDILHHVRAVLRGAGKVPVVADIPLACMKRGARQVLSAAGRLCAAGCAAVKVEWMPGAAEMTRRLTRAGIPVIGHTGLTPQSLAPGEALKARGRTAEDALGVFSTAKRFQKEGARGVLLECVPPELARLITRSLKIPTIGIGAGPACNAQVLVFHDVVGLSRGFHPKFLKTYGEAWSVQEAAVRRFVGETRRKVFPGPAHAYAMEKAEWRRFRRCLR